MKQPVEVEIMGQRLQVASDDGPEHVRIVAQMLDEQMRTLAQANTGANLVQIAILAALNVGSDLCKLREDQERANRDLERLVEVIDAEIKSADCVPF